MTGFAIVKFLEEESVELVPELWVEKGKCHWPVLKSSTCITIMVEKKVQPQSNWQLHNCRVLCRHG